MIGIPKALVLTCFDNNGPRSSTPNSCQPDGLLTFTVTSATAVRSPLLVSCTKQKCPLVDLASIVNFFFVPIFRCLAPLGLGFRSWNFPWALSLLVKRTKRVIAAPQIFESLLGVAR